MRSINVRQRYLAILLVLAAAVLAARSSFGGGAVTGPRPGKYLIHSYGATSKPPLYLGYFLLDKGGTYEVFLPGDKSSGKGQYAFDAKKKEVTWKSGPYEKDWGGAFTLERAGKTHQIRLKRTTVATNSSDAQK
jgi:hypothetical protein